MYTADANSDGKTSEKYRYPERIKTLACIAVVMLHTFYAADAYAGTVSEHFLMQELRNLCQWAVPCFVMVSGALLLESGKQITLEKLWKRYIFRMAAALLFFSFFYAVLDGILNNDLGTGTVLTAIRDIVFGGGYRHMWYLYMMTGIYIFLPVYKYVADFADKKSLIYIISVLAVFQCMIPLAEKATGTDIAFYICVYSVYPFYLLLGHSINKGVIRLPVWISVVFTAVSAGSILLLTVSGTNGNDAAKQIAESYSDPFIALGAAGIFSLFYGMEKKEHKVFDNFCRVISPCSFGIYLLHMAPLRIVFANGHDLLHSGGILAVILTGVGVFILSFGIVFLCRLLLSKAGRKSSKDR